ncbi:beta family protein [Emcibacter nanhaiensis]|uniref:Beta family protein n=1 Tax=Emcibacter nanhaiensis TaxID=1505037 RepID=A0A501PSN0_9PROT|nr:hypothetical protein [Emcibacter nanhaiensis]TPD62731.1 hypothetical protein FIV46_01240 [Emcibacter nanhaiensis]
MVYFPQIKTTTAELKAFKNLHSREDDEIVVPILQLTKPRLSRTLDPLQSLENHMERVFKRIGKNKKTIVDITQDETYQDANLNQFIHDSSDGYIHWINHLNIIRTDYNKNIIPSVIGKAAPDTLPELIRQIDSLYNDYDNFSIRLPANVGEDFSKLQEMFDLLGLTEKTDKLYVLFDFNYVGSPHIEELKGTINVLDEKLWDLNWQSTNVILFSSCPSSFRIGNRNPGTLEQQNMAEYEILEYVQNHCDGISYGDYAYIHPERTDGGGFWLPRIDYPAADQICYYMREFNKDMSRNPNTGKLTIETTVPNDKAYKNISENISHEFFFQNDPLQSWGRNQILENISADKVTGKSPQHYIAVRSNIHMERVISFMR